ncbi:PLP-dependent aminotransferase family protein [Pseudonocardia ailaonensis]|uniref:PLP-dependent aminotransferase family protein n=1 Tax=Pseudonocardia ailaonensis TaxID=367279 RepID=A0ABN2MP90_9PSEU
MRTPVTPFPLSRRLSEVRGSAIRDLLTLTARADVLSLAGGLPAADQLPRERIAEAAARALTDSASVQYSETAGVAGLRAVIADHETGRIGRPVAPTDVVVTSGSQQALDLVARAVLDPGDPVAVEDPVYVGALQVFQASGAQVHALPLDDDGLRVDVLAERLAQGFRPRLVHTVASFHNPRGVTMAPGRRRALAELADRYGFLVVEDDPYGLLAFDGVPPQPIAAHGERIVRLGSASKVIAPALRVGWLVGPPELTAAVERLKQCTDLCSSSLTQAITAELLSDTAWFDGHVGGVRAENRRRAHALTTAVDTRFGDAVVRSTPTGGMFVWLEFADGTDTTALLPKALGQGVGFVPGSAFEAGDTARTSAARLCFATYPGDLLEIAVDRLATAWRA